MVKVTVYYSQMALNRVSQIKSSLLVKKKHLRAKTIFIRAMNEVGSNNVREDGAPVGIQTVLETEH